MLFSLPPEVLTFIFGHLIQYVGIRDSVHLRPVCRAFDRYILDSVFALPTFENVDDDSPGHLTWDINMSKSMIASLIRSKLNTHQEKRALTREILHTTSFVSTSLVDVEEDVYVSALVNLAAKNLPLYKIIRGLSKDFTSQATDAGLLENALAAALSLDQTSHIRSLISLGAKAHVRTKWFGDALQIAATYAAPRSFLLILGTALATDDQATKRLATSRLIMVLEHAATYDRADIFCTDLWTVVEEAYDRCLIHRVFEPAMKSATLACHDNVLLAIFDLLRTHDNNVLYAFDDMYWIEVLRMAASNGSESTVQLVLSNTAVLNVHGGLNLPFEDACRTGRMTVVGIFIAYNTGHSLDSYAGPIYWAAREGHYDMLSLVLRSLGKAGVPYLSDALCGASVHGAAAISRVFEITAEWAFVKKSLALDGKTFAQVIDMIYEFGMLSDSEPGGDLPELRKGSFEMLEDGLFQYLLSEEQLQLERACREGVLSAVHRVVARFGAEDKAASSYSAGGFSKSITHQHPSILQYLCEKFPSDMYFVTDAKSNVRSTAIFQILLDHGWTCDTTSSRPQPPILGSMVQSEELVRWFLDHGSNPNKRHEWDITPFSIAVAKASLSTIRLMLRYGADPHKGQSLHFALERSSPDGLAVIDMLTSFDVPLDARMYENDPASWLVKRGYGMGTPLHRAAERGNADAVAYLLWRGATSGTLDSIGRTALDIATEKNHHEIVEMIENSSI